MKAVKNILLTSLLLLACSAQAQFATGLRFADEDEYQRIEKFSIQLQKNLPPQFDLSKWFPAPGDQGNQASCVGWAIAYGIMTYQEARELNRAPTEDAHTFSPSFIYNQVNDGCMSGCNIQEALNLTKTSGVARITDFPYNEEDCSKAPNQQIKSLAKQHLISSWKRVEFRNTGMMKTLLVKGKPILIGMQTDEWFRDLDSGEVYRVGNHRQVGGHAVVVIGYDDRRGAFKILNSWGEDWGDNGYGWIAYEFFKEVVHEAYVLEDAKSTKSKGKNSAPTSPSNPSLENLVPTSTIPEAVEPEEEPDAE